MVAVASAQNLSRYGIGASEIASIAGLNPYASPWDVWLRKTGQTPELEQSEPMEWGHRLEPAIRQKYVDDTGSVVHVPGESLFSKAHPWARATPDGVVLDKADPLGQRGRHSWRHLVQCKNVGTWVERNWKDAPPAYVQLQEQWEMYVTGLSRADVAVLIGGNEFRIYTIHRDDKAIEDLVTIAEDFWRKVEKRIPPAVDDSDACREHFEKKLRKDAPELIADAETEQLFAEWHKLVVEAKRNKKRTETIRNLIRKQMAEADVGCIRSTLGPATLSVSDPPAPVSETNWKLVAEMMGICDPDRYAELVAANTTTTTPSPKAPILYAPRNWAKES